uniref:Long-chain-fatty-acid--CoA ligase n=1 Tax=Globodera rostochiensis TaxID=31243 RepID=A0A914GPX7_GLORO
MGISQLFDQLRQRCLPYAKREQHQHHVVVGCGMLLLLLAIGGMESAVPLARTALALAGILCVMFVTSQADFIYRSWLTLDRDLTGLFLLIRIRLDMWRRMRENKGIHQLFVDVVNANPDGLCIIDMTSGKQYTFREFNALANRFANAFWTKGYRSGDVVALFMENSAEFVAAWIGLAKIGVVTAWINSNLRMDSLVHCLRVSECKAILCTDTLLSTLEAARQADAVGGLDALRVYALGALNAQFAHDGTHLDTEPPVEEPVPNFRSILCFIFTSGTTGMPKPARIKHLRYYSMALGIAQSFGVRADDRLYISMPLYHTAAGIIGIGQVLLRGSSCVIRARFSASNFWRDCVQHECTISQYIGEICRYLLAQPHCEAEQRHHVRLLFGNGLRTEIWREFVERFKVRVGEVYGSTEGTSNLVNVDGKEGACGFLPISPITKLVHPVRLVKVDENGEIVRRPNGLAIACRPGQTGAMVSTIRPNNPLLVFDGYLNQAETNKKVVHNVIRKGDSAFLTGDILHWDRLGYLYFRIRTGDTFRFKGENVSTAEVEAVLLPLKCIIDAVVYGVRVPELDGSVGMAALVKSDEAGTDDEFLGQLSTRLRANLPAYAIPRFIRICSAVDRTATFKLIKTNLQRIGLARHCVAPAATAAGDRLFLMDPCSKEYRPLEECLRQRLNGDDELLSPEGNKMTTAPEAMEAAADQQLISRVFA